MRQVISLLLLLFLIIAPLRANLGETVQQCVARYGKPNGLTEAGPKSPFGTLTFVSGGLVLIVFVHDNKEVGARVSKADKSAFSEDDLQNIMNADSAAGKWISTPSDDPSCLAWKRSDNAQVLYDQTKHMVIFTSQEMSDVLNAPPPPSASSNATSSNTMPTPTNVAPAPATQWPAIGK